MPLIHSYFIPPAEIFIISLGAQFPFSEETVGGIRFSSTISIDGWSALAILAFRIKSVELPPQMVGQFVPIG